MDDDQIKEQHDLVCKRIQELLKDFSEEGVRTDLVLHASLCVVLDYALDSAPNKATLFGLIASAMAGAHEAHSDQECEECEKEDEGLH